MSEDVGYMGDELDWACGSGSNSSHTHRGSNWMTWTSIIVGVLALSTALFAVFAPRRLVERTQRKVEEAVSSARHQAREKAHQVKAKAQHAKDKAQQVMEEIGVGSD